MIIGSNFDLSSRLYLDSRQLCDSYADLIENKNNILYPPGFEVYCFKEKTKYYNACENIEDKPVWKEAARGSIAEVFIESDTIPENKDLYWIDTGTVDTLGNQSAHEGIIKELLETVRNLQKRILVLEEKVGSGIISPTTGDYLQLADGTNLQLADGTFLELSSGDFSSKKYLQLADGTFLELANNTFLEIN